MAEKSGHLHRFIGFAGAAITALLLFFIFLHPAYLGFLNNLPRCFSCRETHLESACTDLSTGIPYTLHSGDRSPRILVQGDHLQLKYHFDLAADMISGKIPFFSNLYEFNLGNDADRRIVDPYYIPYSLVYAAVRGCFGDAGAWNFAQYVSILTGFIFLFLLGRRFSGGSGFLAFLAAAVASAIPFWWATLAGGSPTGFGMGLVPGVALGLDVAIRDGRIRGGILAGVLLFLCYCTDLHCFLFSAITVPCWCIVSWLARGESLIPKKTDVVPLAASLCPVAVSGLVSVFIALRLRAAYSVTNVSAGRAFDEIRPHSPDWRALFSWRYPCPAAAHFSLGYILPIVLVAAAIAATAFLIYVFVRRERHEVSRHLVAPLLFLVIALIIVLALGARGPFYSLPIRAARKVFPPYRMIRQPVKIYCLMPTFTAMALAAIMREILTVRGAVFWKAAFALIAVLSVSTTTYGMHPGTCILPGRNSAYDAVVADGVSRGITPRALVLPIWPGDSSFSSVYEYYASQSRLRMLNGYSPVMTKDYVTDVFGVFETMNLGDLTDFQLERLRRYGVSAVILHENGFPAKVSPLPVGETLRRLLSDVNLKFLKRDGDVWAFSLLDMPCSADSDVPLRDNAQTYPTKVWTYVRESLPYGMEVSPKLNRKFLLRVRKPAEWMEKAGPVWLMSSAGSTVFADKDGVPREGKTILLGNAGLFVSSAVSEPGNDWTETHVISPEGSGRLKYAVYMPAGVKFIDSGITMPASDFPHSGRIVWDGGDFRGIELLPESEPPGGIDCGPNLPILGGRWLLRLVTLDGKPAPGSIRVILNGVTSASASASNGEIEFEAEDGDLFSLIYDYDRTARVLLKEFVLSRKFSPSGVSTGERD